MPRSGPRPSRRCPAGPRFQLLPLRVHPQIQAFKGTSPEKRQIAWLSEHDFINRKKLAQADDGKPDAARDLLTIGHHKADVLLFARDGKTFELLGRNSRVLASGVHEDRRHGHPPRAVGWVLDLAPSAKRSHVDVLCTAHSEPSGTGLSQEFLPPLFAYPGS